jgi:ATP-dependent Clp protease ATP-binding subunit ClpC
MMYRWKTQRTESQESQVNQRSSNEEGEGTMWQRFTERARRVILLGQEEAGKMGSGHVGTEHLLLGLVSENEGVAAQVLQKMGVSLERARAEIVAEVEQSGESSSGEPKLTPKAKRVLELAADEARRMRHNYIGTEHLLLALLREKDGLAAKVLRKLGLNLDKVRTQVMEYLGPDASSGEASVARSRTSKDVSAEFDVTPDLQDILTRAALHGKREGDSTVTVERLLLVLLRGKESWGVGMLRDCGLDVDKALIEIKKHLGSDNV